MASSIGLRLHKPLPITFGRNSLFDVMLVVGGGLPLILPVFLLIGETRFSQQVPFDFIFWSNQLVSMPHAYATYMRLNRKISEGRVPRVFGLPSFLLILALLIFASLHGFFLQVMTAVNVWQSYHYLRQVWGVGRYFTRPQFETDLEKKLSFWAYHAAMPLFILGRWNMLFAFWHGKPSDAIIPVGFPAPVMVLLWIIGIVALLIGLSGEALKIKRARESGEAYDCSALVNLLVYFGIHWYGFLSTTFYYTGFAAVTAFHAIQYLAISWKFEDRQQSSDILQTRLLKMLPAAGSFLAFCTFLYFAGDFVQNHIFTLGNGFWPQFTGACLSTISAHHYLVDTMMWTREAGP